MKNKPKYSFKKPPHYLILKILFGFDWNLNIAAFGDTIHAKHPLPDHLEVHESIHLHQQKYSKIYAIWWWIKYIVSKKFRLSQELEAYRNEWHFIQYESSYSMNQKLDRLEHIVFNLSSKLYGNIVSHDEAISLITKQ